MSQDKVQGKVAEAPYEPFISFYRANNISPVRQNLSQLELHLSRRDHLARQLGLPPFAFTGKTVVEFGPGSGYNALYTISRSPSRYVLVDGNPTGLRDAEALLKQYYPDSTCHELVFSRIQDFESAERFDVVLCEGVIPHQLDPGAFSRHVAKYARPGGVVAITTADYVGVFAEVLRRLIRDTLIEPDAPFAQQIAKLVPVFTPHLKTLAGMTRPVEDWIADNVIHPWQHALFPIDQAIEALAAEFEVYGSSPQFLTDWRWYKDIHGTQARLNENAIAQYRAECLSFLDYRFKFAPADIATCDRVRQLCEAVYWAMIDIEIRGKPRFDDVAQSCDELSGLLRPISGRTAEALHEASTYFAKPGKLDPARHFSEFVSLFGRAQQYLSFIRNS